MSINPRKLRLLLIFSLVSHIVVASTQSNESDIRKKAKHYSEKARAYKKSGKMDSCLLANKQALELYKQLNDCREIASTLMNIGVHVCIQKSDFQQSINYLNQSKEYYHCHQDNTLQTKVYNNLGSTSAHFSKFLQAYENFQQALKYATLSQDTFAKIVTINNIAYTYSQLGSFSEALEYYFQALTLINTVEDKPLKITLHINIGLIYEKIKERKKSLFHLNQAVKLWGDEKDNMPSISTLIDMANAFFNLAQPEKSKEIYEMILAKETVTPYEYILANNGLGQFHTCNNNSERAIVHLNKALIKALETNHIYEEAKITLSLGKNYMGLNDVETAISFLKKTQYIADSLGFIHLKIETEKQLSKIYTSKKDFEKAYACFVSYSVLSDSIEKKNQYDSINVIQEKYALETHKKNQEILEQQLKIENSKNVINKLLIAVSVCFLIGLVLFLVITKRKQHKLYQATIKLNALEKQKLIETQERNKEQLDDFLKTLEEKKALIKGLESQLKGTDNANKNLFGSKILTEEHWEEFKRKFDSVYSGFMEKLRQQYSLTKAEERLFILIKLKFQSNEIADMLGISTFSIKRYRNRLRKKLNLSSKERLEKFIENF